MAEIKISLAAARVNAKMTQAEVARIMRVSKNTLIAWENGKHSPSAASLHMLSDIYKIPEDNFLLLSK